jgi:hypothetical protein
MRIRGCRGLREMSNVEKEISNNKGLSYFDISEYITMFMLIV